MLALGVLSIAGLSSLRLYLAVRQWAFLDSLPGVSPLYISVMGLVWALAAAPLSWGLWWGQPCARRYSQIAALSYAAYYWFERLFLFDRISSRLIHLPGNVPFALLATVLCLCFVYWSTSSAKARLFFGVTHERSP